MFLVIMCLNCALICNQWQPEKSYVAKMHVKKELVYGKCAALYIYVYMRSELSCIMQFSLIL